MPADARPFLRRCVAAVFVVTALGPGCIESRTAASEEAHERASIDDGELPRRALPATDLAPEAPISLTASDGTGLRLVSVNARAVVQAPLAFTELRLTFENPENRTLEGQFTIDLPPEAAISRFAMKIDGRWQEGEVVERQAARAVYEDFLHRKQDPALLENQGGNRFSARVFPIPPRAHKELVLSYSQALTDADAPYELPLVGLPRLDRFDAEVVVEQPAPDVVLVSRRNYRPTEDLEVPLPRAGEAVGLRHGELAVARVTADGSLPEAPIDELTILFDTSASRALGFSGHIHRLGELVEALRRDGDFRLRVVAFDQVSALVFDDDASELGIEELTAIYSRRALGASDLAGALRRVAETGTASSRLLVISDGVATGGDTAAAAIEQAARRLGEHGVDRIDAIVDGALRDGPMLEALTTAGLEQAGIVADTRLPAHELADKLGKGTLRSVPVSVPGSAFAWPRTIQGVQAGDEVLVYAQLPAHAKMTVVLGGDAATQAEVDLVEVDSPLLERALAGARIEALTLERSELGDAASEGSEALRREIIRLSTTHRVLSDFTALLVLETEHDYERFRIDRNALVDIMTIGDGGLESVHRRPPERLEQRARNFDPDMFGSQAQVLGMIRQSSGHFLASPYGGAFSVGKDDEDVWGGVQGTEIGEAFGVGGLGLVGTGRGGGGIGEGTIGLGSVAWIGKGTGGRGFGRRGTRVPRVRMAKGKVRGAVEEDIVRRIVRAHLNEIRHCYNQGLVHDPKLRGRVTVQFTISQTGRVPVAVVSKSSLKDAAAARCMIAAVKRWTFVRPRGGGTAVATYTFVFAPLDGPVIVPSQPRLAPVPPEPPPPPVPAEPPPQPQPPPASAGESPYTGRMLEIMSRIERGDPLAALDAATDWHDDAPGDVVALLALGEALERTNKPQAAARAYGSLIDLFPSRADIRRYAGMRLERLGDTGRALAIDTYRKAVEQRPDHPNSHRLYAYALLRDGRPRAAFDAIVAGATRSYPWGRFEGVGRILQEDVGLIAAAWIAAEPALAEKIAAKAKAAGAKVPSKPSTRFVMSWETDANDVDFHIYDSDNGHAFYGAKTLPSGGTLYADVTTGYGPECFTIEGKADAYPYRFDAKYFSRGPMGYGMGTLQVIEHDGEGTLHFDDRPFIIMRDGATIPLGSVESSLADG